ncbi:tyrosine-type recombinase/integrase, partial [Campylobacter jejuni]
AKALISKKGLHLLRHTLAMRLTAKGTNLVVIQKILRHANLNTTTTIYAKATNDTIKAALLNN